MPGRSSNKNKTFVGVDLVEWQLKIAAGEKLPLAQEQIVRNGHSFEARVYAEDPDGGFLPGAGTLSHLRSPCPGEDTRIETGVREGDEVSVYYDPMIAKLVVWGKDRPEALLKLEALLKQYNVAGLETNVNFLLDLARHPEFKAGNVHTNFIKDNHSTLFKDRQPSRSHQIDAALAVTLKQEAGDSQIAAQSGDRFNPFVVESGFRVNHLLQRDVKLRFKDREFTVKVKYGPAGVFEASTDNGQTWTKVRGELYMEESQGLSLKRTTDEGERSSVNVYINDDIVSIFDDNGKTEFSLERPSFLLDSEEDASLDRGTKSVAPMPGVLDKVLVKAGDVVKKGDSLFVLIAMKMEHVVKANRDGTIAAVLHKAGDSVLKDTTIVQFEEREGKGNGNADNQEDEGGAQRIM